MHVPDGFLDAPTSVATGVVAAVGIGLALRGARRELDDRTAPLAGLVATFIFATQMLNFPVGAGHQRPPARRRAGRGARRARHGPALHERGVPRAVPALRRRRHHRARHQHLPDGHRHRRGRLGGLPRPADGAAQARLDGRARRGRRGGAGVGAGRGARVRRPVRRRRHRRHPARQPDHRHGRRAHADRHRRGRDHLPGRRQHRRGPARPRVRRPAGAGDPLAGAADGRASEAPGLHPAPRRRRPRSWRCCWPASRASTPPATRTA